MAGLPGLDYTRSVSRAGLSQVTVVFDDGTDIYFARQLVNERLQGVAGNLPPGMEPALGPIATGLGEIFMYTLESKPGARKDDGTPYTAEDLRTLHDWVVRPQLRNVPGVTEVNSVGGYRRQYVVAPIPARLSGFGLTVADLTKALESNNANVGAGYVERSGAQSVIRVPGKATGEARSVGHHRRLSCRHPCPHRRCRRCLDRFGNPTGRGHQGRARGGAGHDLHAGRRERRAM